MYQVLFTMDLSVWFVTIYMKWLQVNTLSEWIIGIHLHKFANNEWEILIPHKALQSVALNILSSLLVNDN